MRPANFQNKKKTPAWKVFTKSSIVNRRSPLSYHPQGRARQVTEITYQIFIELLNGGQRGFAPTRLCHHCLCKKVSQISRIVYKGLTGDFSRLLDKIISSPVTRFHNKVPIYRSGNLFENLFRLKENSCPK